MADKIIAIPQQCGINWLLSCLAVSRYTIGKYAEHIHERSGITGTTRRGIFNYMLTTSQAEA